MVLCLYGFDGYINLEGQLRLYYLSTVKTLTHVTTSERSSCTKILFRCQSGPFDQNISMLLSFKFLVEGVIAFLVCIYSLLAATEKLNALSQKDRSSCIVCFSPHDLLKISFTIKVLLCIVPPVTDVVTHLLGS